MMAQIWISLLTAFMAFAAAALVARRVRRTGPAILAGVTIGMAVLIAIPAVLALLGFVAPYGQLAFWLSAKLHNVLG